MIKEIEIKLNIEFPEYEELKAAIKECERKWKKDDFIYDSEVTYKHLLALFPGGYFRIYSSDDVDYKLSFDEMHEGYLFNNKLFPLTKKGYKELIEYAINVISRGYKAW